MVKPRSLAFRLTVSLAAAWLALFLALGALVWQSAQKLIHEAQADKAQALAAQLATVSLDAVLLRDYGTLERFLADLAGQVAYAEVRRADGQVLAQTGKRLPDQAVVRAPMHVTGGGIDENIGEVLAQYDPNPARRAIWQLAAVTAAGLVALAALTFWGLRRLLLNRLVAPVAALIAQATPEHPPASVAADLPSEVAELAEAIAALRQRIDRHLAEAEDAAQSRNEALRRLCSEQRLAAIGQMAGEVAHELNTPLSNILGYAQSALPLTEDVELRESLQTIEAQARRAGQIVRDMLTAARAPAPSLQAVDAAALCAGFMRLFTPLARKQNVQLELTAPDSLMLRADPARIEQILFNLVTNAIQAGARYVSLSLSALPACIEVTDDGPGLPESVRARLFEPFVTTKPAGQGTGLGLAISQRLAKEMGAELRFVEAHAGCSFLLSFPPPGNDL
jgi:signal transduction histidine kinase